MISFMIHDIIKKRMVEDQWPILAIWFIFGFSFPVDFMQIIL